MTPERMIDTSKWQGNYTALPLPNYAQLIPEQVTTVIMKAMQGSNIDQMFTYARSECERLNLKWTGYHFWGKDDTTRMAQTFANLVKGSDYPPVVDFEPVSTTPISVASRLIDFLLAVEDVVGVKPWIYTASWCWNRMFPVAPEWVVDYKLWVAAYPLKKPSLTVATQWDMTNYSYQAPSLPRGWANEQVVGWQFSEKGFIPTFSSAVDLDWLYPENI